MTLSGTDWARYRDTLSKISKKAVEELDKFVENIGGYAAHEYDVVAYAYAIATRYGEAAAELACMMYDAMAAAENVAVLPAVPAATATIGEVADAMAGANELSSSLVSPAVGRLVKLAAADTTLQNARRDGAQFAWIPSGDTCAYCLAIASRGWQYVGKDAKESHAEHIHNNCDCQFAVRFHETTNIGGYDPARYRKMYNDAPGRNSKDKINALRREAYAEDKERINEMKRANYAARRAEESELIENID